MVTKYATLLLTGVLAVAALSPSYVNAVQPRHEKDVLESSFPFKKLADAKFVHQLIEAVKENDGDKVEELAVPYLRKLANDKRDFELFEKWATKKLMLKFDNDATAKLQEDINILMPLD